ncbi:hypothetical protein N0V90_008465 [Kalmusia sp. IMI 367209]|nr:hypothetical protein N0V90_008465 [Kalmusia sp. IMI 367209]
MHAVTILLHDFAIERSEWEKVVPVSVISESRDRSDTAAKEIIAVLPTHEALVNLHILHSAIMDFEDESVFFKTLLDDISMHLAAYNSGDIALML